MGAYEKKDFILYGDLLELQMLPILAELQANYIQRNPLEPSYGLFLKNIKVFQKIDSTIARKLEEMLTPDFYLNQYGC